MPSPALPRLQLVRALCLAALLPMAACGDGKSYDVKADLGTALIVIASPSASRDRLLRVGREACGERKVCQARIWTDGQWAPRDTTWPPGARENVAMIFNRYPGSNGDFHRWNCRRFSDVPAAECIPF